MADNTASQQFDLGASLIDLGKTAISGFFGSQVKPAAAVAPQVIVQSAPTPTPKAAAFNPYYIAGGAAALVMLVLLLRH